MCSRNDSDSDSVRSGLDGSLQFVINNEPHLPRSREHEKLIRSHVMRKSRAIQKRKNNVPVQRRKLLQKVAPRLSDQPDVSIDTANTNSKTANTFQLSREADWRGPTDRKAPTAISVGSDSDLCLTPALPVREVQQSQSAFLESEFGSIEK